jgi:ABC-type transport system involved in cytochrome bd biosynthesis fused ATPase/permease subunit
LTVFYNVLNGYWYLGQSAPFVEAFSTARSAARAIYDVIDRVPTIDGGSPLGRVLPSPLKGHTIVFDNVGFAYPARPGVPVLEGLSLTVPGSRTVALVGASGCGKSTCIQLIQRFYDPLQAKQMEEETKARCSGQRKVLKATNLGSLFNVFMCQLINLRARRNCCARVRPRNMFTVCTSKPNQGSM